MRPSLNLRNSRPVQVIIGALTLAIPTSAVALSARTADAQSALQVTFNHHRISYGQSLIVTGVAPRTDAGQRLVLELAPAGESWRVAGSTVVRSNGRFRIVTVPRHTGAVRVVRASASLATGAADTGAGSAAFVASVPSRVAVAAALRSASHSIAGLSGQPVDIRGTLLPRKRGRVVVLEGGSGHGWHTLARTRTRRSGRFDVRYTAGNPGNQIVRLRFAGDRLNGSATTHAAELTFYRQSVASWYSDGGSTACGFHATYGVANRDLPCGTKVSFRYNGRTVTATVDDRGPFVGGRDWDLNQNTAGALGFGGVDTVWSSR